LGFSGVVPEQTGRPVPIANRRLRRGRQRGT
jgi:hypothetical protein